MRASLAASTGYVEDLTPPAGTEDKSKTVKDKPSVGVRACSAERSALQDRKADRRKLTRGQMNPISLLDEAIAQNRAGLA
ncbi:hypothetical protein [Rhodovulum sulfidophilum]|uniref:hypothetical protein n=1 Tax=Rhodovulum sulfidophilum TaxID=35806 RepID=UPI0019236F97|nr:hypothetical protein [Rhodovulum sulfidophilum]MBL3572487.1 hypothetical protein [Rhodovulum sulfidophilum]MCE8431331.1 hypothetical protein [Rhodovulum sulfidophilum]